jgi:membrane-associated phospholipid phosphatase
MLIAWVQTLALAATPASGSVYHADPLISGTVIAAGAVAVLVPYALSEKLIDPTCPCDQADLNALDRSVIGNESPLAFALSTFAAGLAMAAPFAVDIVEVYHSPAFWEDFAVYAETLAISSAAVTISKHVAQRPLPIVYAEPDSAIARRAEGYRSFYSGHMSGSVSMMTALAMTMTYRHGLSFWPWALDAGVAGLVGAGVIGSGRHFYTDVLVGAAVGFAIGVAVPMLHRRRGDRSIRLSAMPVENGEGALLSIGASW